MRKRLLSGLLAMLLLSSPAFAAGTAGVPATGTQTESVSQTGQAHLQFSVTVPPTWDVDFMGEAVAQQTKEVIEKRLTQHGFTGVTVEPGADGKTITVTLPQNADLAMAASIAATPGVLHIEDADGTVWLSNEAVIHAEAKTGRPLGTETEDRPYLELKLGGDATVLLSEATASVAARQPGENELTALIDGEPIGSLPVSAQMSSDTLALPGNLTQQEATWIASLLNIGPLPVTLTNINADTLPDALEPVQVTNVPEQSADADPEQEQPPEPEQPTVTEPEKPVYTDTQGHWAQYSLEKSVQMGLLNGADGKLRPDDVITYAEVLVILCRALQAQQPGDISGLKNVPRDAWYTDGIAKAVHLGLIPQNDERNFNVSATRAATFEMLAKAFSYDGTDGASALSNFRDTGTMTDAQKNAAGILAKTGIINGTEPNVLNPNGLVTRAQFITMLLRAVQDIATSSTDLDALQGKVLLNKASVALSGKQTGDRIFACGTQNITFSNISTSDRVVLKGSEAVALTANGPTTIGTLVADPAGTATIKVPYESKIKRLLITGQGGAVSFTGQADVIEIASTSRRINLSGINATSIIVTGAGNVITMDGNSKNFRTMLNATHTTLTLNGQVQDLVLDGRKATVNGSGRATRLNLRAGNCTINIDCDKRSENIPSVLKNLNVAIGVPTKVTPENSTLITQFKFTNVAEPLTCKLEWYQDGKLIPDKTVKAFQITEGAYTRHSTSFTFQRNMPASVKMGIKLTCYNPSTGENEDRLIEKVVPIENYSEEWYVMKDAGPVLEKVSSVYRGNYTTAYAKNNDYSASEKEIWINAKGYSSSTEYLCWINRAYQHVNVFQGSKYNWKLVKSFIVGTGASGTPTPVGQTVVSYKSSAGWTTGTYTVRPVVGFYPGTGYAFHSRLCYPGTTTEYDFSSGYPVSHGCVRMQRSDINWIYNNIPVGTRVVIF